MTAKHRTYGTGMIVEHKTVTGATMLYGRFRTPDGRRQVALGPKRTPGYADGLTKRDAEAKLREVIDAARKTPERPATRGVTLERAADAYLSAKDREGTTISDYRSALDQHVLPFFGNTTLASIDRERCRAFVAHLRELTSRRTGRPLSAKTIANYAGVLTFVLNFAVDEGWIKRTPMRGVTLPTAPAHDDDVLEDDQFLTPEDVEALVGHATRPYDAALYRVAAQAGARKSECLGLRWRDVDFEHGILRLHLALKRGGAVGRPKSGKGRAVPMSSVVKAALLTWRNTAPAIGPDDRVFTGAWTSTRERYIAALTAAGLDPSFRFHDLRHSFATTLAAAGYSQREVMELCGHASPAVTAKYMHRAPVKAADVERLDAAFGHVANQMANMSTPGVPESTSEHLKSA
jgi:integrase